MRRSESQGSSPIRRLRRPLLTSLAVAAITAVTLALGITGSGAPRAFAKLDGHDDDLVSFATGKLRRKLRSFLPTNGRIWGSGRLPNLLASAGTHRLTWTL